MPTLDDAPIVRTLNGGEDLTAAEAVDTANLSREDLIQVYDKSERQAKTITVGDFAEALGLTLI